MKKRFINIGGEQIEVTVPDRKIILYGIIGIIALWIVFSSIYTVDADEVGIIQRFGRYTKTSDPGLNFKLPWGIETVKKVKVQRVFKEEFGFRTVSAGVRTEYSTADYSDESLMLTGDLNAALVEWIVQYRIKDPVAYLFRVRNVEKTIRYVSESTMRQVVGDNSVDEVITVRRQEIAPEVKELMQGLLDEYETGIDVITVNLQDVNPPIKVQPAFNEVNEAEQERERIVNEALQVYNSAIPRAKGEAEQVILEAEGYATNRVNRAQGDAEKFIAVWREYSKAKNVTQRRLYLEMMQEVLPKLDKKIIVDEDLSSFLPLLQLDAKGGAR
jgi:membrane protease subunit HflK